MKWAIGICGCAALAVLLTGQSKAPAGGFQDPAPPKPASVPPLAVLKKQPNPEVKFHQKPKPLPKGAVTSDWPSFLGPTHDGISPETKLLKDWPAGGPRLVWEMSKGSGYSSPAIAGGYLVYLDRRGEAERVRCVAPETGELYWEFQYPTQFEDRYGYNNGPRSSPVIDGDVVYTYGAEGKLHCLRLKDGQMLWKRDLRGEFKVPQDFFGTATTPLLDGNLLIVNIGAPGGPTVVAFDKKDGHMVWGAGREWGPSYATPRAATVNGKRKIFVFAGGESRPPTGGLMVIDARTGALEFQYPWRSRSYESVNASSPVVIGDEVFISATYKTGSALLRIPAGEGGEQVWVNRDIGLHFNTPIYKDGYLYGYDGRNEPDASIVGIEWKTGKVVWREIPEWEELINSGGSQRKQLMSTYRGNLLFLDGQFLSLGELGHLLWLDLTPKGYKEQKRAWLFAARETWCPPVVSHGLLYISQNSRDVLNGTSPRLLCYDLRAAQ